MTKLSALGLGEAGMGTHVRLSFWNVSYLPGKHIQKVYPNFKKLFLGIFVMTKFCAMTKPGLPSSVLQPTKDQSVVLQYLQWWIRNLKEKWTILVKSNWRIRLHWSLATVLILRGSNKAEPLWAPLENFLLPRSSTRSCVKMKDK